MIAVIDYGIGNVRSVLNALEYIGVQAVITRDIKEISRSKGIILPGVGAFGAGIQKLEAYGLSAELLASASAGKPLLGICLGFQMLMRSSVEMGEFQGLHLQNYDVIRLPVEERLPHMSWSRVYVASNSRTIPYLLEGLDGQSFYFVHSYGIAKPEGSVVAGLSEYAGYEFLSLIESGNIFGTQFHPEKSGEAGLEMLRKFARLCS